MRSFGAVEIRVTKVDDLAKVMDSGADIIGFGQEGCLIKAPDVGEIRHFIDVVRESGLRSTLVIPIAWPRSASSVIELAEFAIAEGVDNVVVNDWGSALAIKPKSKLIAGLSLTRAQMPVTESSVRDTRLDGSVISMVNELGMVGVEVDPAVQLDDVKGDCQIGAVLGPELIGWARSCPILRARRREGFAENESCRSFCDAPVHLQATSRWRLVDGKREVLPAGKPVTKVSIWGNAIYGNMTNSKIRNIDKIIIDKRHIQEDLSAIIIAARGLLAEQFKVKKEGF